MESQIVAAIVALVAFLSVMLLGDRLLNGRHGVVRATVGDDGVQEAEIVVRGRYRPDLIIVRKNVPVRLLFKRQEDNPCSERVFFSDFHQECRLRPFATSQVQFIPTRRGDFLFTCDFGMYQGWLVVEEPASLKESAAGETTAV